MKVDHTADNKFDALTSFSTLLCLNLILFALVLYKWRTELGAEDGVSLNSQEAIKSQQSGQQESTRDARIDGYQEDTAL